VTAPLPDEGDLRPLLRPRGIAVVGASADPGRFSGRIVPALLACGYGGGIYPVNPRRAEVAGRPCFPSLREVPEPCDLAIVAVPAAHVPEVVAQAAGRGVGAALVMSGGFEELGPGSDGARRAEALRAAAGIAPGRRPRVRVYGPNCPGLWQIRDGLVYTFSAQFDPRGLRPGPVGLVTQGGALGRAVLDAMELGLGFSYWFSTGNEADLQAADFVAWLASDPGTRVLAAILEGIRDRARWQQAVARCRAAGKPLVVLRIGRSEAGARAAAAHTGVPWAGPRADGELDEPGCVPVDDVDELIDLAWLFAAYPEPPGEGRGIGVCTFSGGAGGLLADQAAAAGAPLPALAPATVAALRATLPEIGSAANPADLTTAVFEDPDLGRRALEALAADPAVGVLAFPLPHRHDAFDAEMAHRLVDLAPRLGKPLVVVAPSPTFDREEAAAILRQAGVPVFASVRRAALACARWLRHGRVAREAIR
jgi:acyl-CoA synthetase (NDP forming)